MAETTWVLEGHLDIAGVGVILEHRGHPEPIAWRARIHGMHLSAQAPSRPEALRRLADELSMAARAIRGEGRRMRRG